MQITGDGMSGDGQTYGEVGRTALGAALIRAKETSRTDRLFSDTYAESFFRAGAAAFSRGFASASPASGASVQQQKVMEARSLHVVMRTRFFDDLLVEAAAGGIRQAVMIGSGLDARAFRLGLDPDFAIYELDSAGVNLFKNRVLNDIGAVPHCARTGVSCDLQEAMADPLVEAGFQTQSAAIWIAEGVLPYFEPDRITAMIGEIDRLSGPGSRFAFDDPGEIYEDFLSDTSLAGFTKLANSGGEQRAVEALENLGWDIDLRLGRSLYEDADRGFSEAASRFFVAQPGKRS